MAAVRVSCQLGLRRADEEGQALPMLLNRVSGIRVVMLAMGMLFLAGCAGLDPAPAPTDDQGFPLSREDRLGSTWSE